MKLDLSYKKPTNEIPNLHISSSKSESNRWLILNALFNNITINNLSNSDDTLVLKQALNSSEKVINVGHAGTAFRFLTAYFASIQGREITLTGSHQMQKRPILDLVKELLDLGADITYLNKEGYPPLLIKGKNLTSHQVTIKASTSSQYISALMLIAPSLKNGLEITLKGKLTSKPYVFMTASILKKIGVSCVFSKNTISIKPYQYINHFQIDIESDWSSASYFYSCVAFSENLRITLKNFKKESIQGDAEVAKIYELFGVETSFNNLEQSITISKTSNKKINKLELDLKNTPDLAQTIAVTCFGLKIPCVLTGLTTLKIKETNRLEALKTELEKLGATILITQESLKIKPPFVFHKNRLINTYQDHRMAMAFAPLAMLFPIQINEAEVVSKSFPTFWNTINKIGIQSIKLHEFGD
ncbi:MAG: 3-phosphoshikimate 1-carboxyvinyltransferase [Flavobacteriales bacterium]